MRVESVAGFAVITPDSAASEQLYVDKMNLPLENANDYLHMGRFPGVNHFGIWPLSMAAQSCFGCSEWPEQVPVPGSTIEFELHSVAELEAAVAELQSGGVEFVHSARLEPWGQTTARFLSPELVLIGLTYSPWLHEGESSQ